MKQWKLVPGCLMLRLMERCNNRCQFCMVRNEIGRGPPLPIAQLTRLIREQPTGTEIDFFGGEPTLNKGFWELLKAAAQSGHVCSIESNVRLFARKHFARKLWEIGGGRIHIQTSLHGPSPRAHDSITQVEGSFIETRKGIENLLSLGIKLMSNTVVTTLITSQIIETLEILESWEVTDYKLSLLVDADRVPWLTPKMEILRPEIHMAIEWASNRNHEIRIEKAPFCLAKDFIDKFIYEQAYTNERRVFADPGSCGKCLLRHRCYGLDVGHLKLHGNKEVLPIKKVTRDQVLFLDESSINNFSPLPERLRLLCWDLEHENRLHVLRNLETIRQKALAMLGDIAFVPPDAIE